MGISRPNLSQYALLYTKPGMNLWGESKDEEQLLEVQSAFEKQPLLKKNIVNSILILYAPLSLRNLWN